jgi:histidine triad (HIT) family protein
MNNSCIFCKIIARQISSSIVYETDDILVIKDIAPKAPIHYLIIPKKHAPDIQSLSDDDKKLAGEIFLTAQKLSQMLSPTTDFRLLVNSGAQAGQKVFHLHAHYISGKTMSDF